MANLTTYWTRTNFSRRAALRTAALGGSGLAALSLVGCGGSDKQSPAPREEGRVDPTKGIPGGTFYAQSVSAPPNFLVLGSGTAGSHYRQLVYSGLLQFDWGQAGQPGDVLIPKPDVAQALPEQPDSNTYVFKVRPGVKFHSGRTVTAEDVKYSYTRNATWDQVPRKPFWFWFDRVETPDPLTVVVKSKSPYADAINIMTAHNDAYLLAPEAEEGPDAATKPIGTGPYLFVDNQAPIVTTFKRNPEYFDKPYPYFDEVKSFAAQDSVRRVTDFTTRQVHIAWWYSEELRDQVKRDRPDALSWSYPAAGWSIWVRTDQRPLTDKRVRQALSMTVDRKAIREAVSKGEGEDDQALSYTNRTFGFRKPKELGAAAKYWNYDPAEAKKLLAAAGVDRAFESSWSHLDPSVDGQPSIDQAVITQARWRELGIANIKDVNQASAQFNATSALGNYDGFAHRPGLSGVTPATMIRTLYWSPPEGVKPPTTNVGYVNNTQMNSLLDKQIAQLNIDERKQTLRQIEDILAEEQYRLTFSSLSNTWFADPSIKNISMPFYCITGQNYHWKYWWFQK